MKLKSFANAINLQNETPCTKYACENFTRCAGEKLACTAFVLYVRTGRVLNPKFRYQISGGVRDRNPQPLDHAEATRGLFEAMEAS